MRKSIISPRKSNTSTLHETPSKRGSVRASFASTKNQSLPATIVSTTDGCEAQPKRVSVRDSKTGSYRFVTLLHAKDQLSSTPNHRQKPKKETSKLKVGGKTTDDYSFSALHKQTLHIKDALGLREKCFSASAIHESKAQKDFPSHLKNSAPAEPCCFSGKRKNSASSQSIFRSKLSLPDLNRNFSPRPGALEAHTTQKVSVVQFLILSRLVPRGSDSPRKAPKGYRDWAEPVHEEGV
jgi:hypothetical protein